MTETEDNHITNRRPSQVKMSSTKESNRHTEAPGEGPEAMASADISVYKGTGGATGGTGLMETKVQSWPTPKESMMADSMRVTKGTMSRPGKGMEEGSKGVKPSYPIFRRQEKGSHEDTGVQFHDNGIGVGIVAGKRNYRCQRWQWQSNYTSFFVYWLVQCLTNRLSVL
jgi:hypothetical protein